MRLTLFLGLKIDTAIQAIMNSRIAIAILLHILKARSDEEGEYGMLPKQIGKNSARTDAKQIKDT
jgi:hypothetical protein